MARRYALYVLGGLLALFTLAQFIPVKQPSLPPSEAPAVPPEALSVLRTACFDCHSQETAWPWYSYVAPASWLVTHEVNQARAEMNFSKWNSYTEAERAELLGEIKEQLEAGNMPPLIYLPTNPGARLTDAQKALLKDWTGKAAPRLSRQGKD